MAGPQEEARIRLIAASNIAPHVDFDIRVVARDKQPSRGYYLLIVPPSTLRPHAVRKSQEDLRYPERDGTTKRWLSEPEVADAYRNRHRLATDQANRVARVLDDGLGAMALDGHAFLAVAMVPTGLGSMMIDAARVAAIGRWVAELGEPNYFEGFFHPTVSHRRRPRPPRDAEAPVGDGPAAGLGVRRTLR